MNIDAVRQRLLQLQSQILERVERTRSHFQNREEISPDFAEQVKERENDEVISALEAEGRDELRRIEAALRRVDDGSYGICTSCGGPVGDGRLQAIPYAEHCVKCADKPAGA